MHTHTRAQKPAGGEIVEAVESVTAGKQPGGNRYILQAELSAHPSNIFCFLTSPLLTRLLSLSHLTPILHLHLLLLS